MPSPPTQGGAGPGGLAVVAISEWMPVAPAGLTEAEGEWVELEVLAGGSLAGVTVTDNDGADDFVFPAMDAEAGARIVLANGRTPPPGAPAGSAVLFMGKSSWTWENSGDDAVVRAPNGTTMDRWAFGSGAAVDPPAPDWPAGGAVAFGPPPAGASLAAAGGARGAARPTPGGDNALLETAPYAGLAVAGFLQGRGTLAVVLCNELTRTFEPHLWTLVGGSASAPLAAGPVPSGACVGWTDGLPAPVLQQLEALVGRPVSPWIGASPVPGPDTSAGLMAADPWGRRQTLIASAPGPAPAASPAAWWSPCACDGGWRPEPFGAVPAIGPAEPMAAVSVVAAGVELGAALVSLLDGARQSVAVNAYVLSEESFAEALERAASRGVSVRLLVEPRPVGWGVLEGGLPETMRVSLAEAGVEVRAFAAGPPNADRDHAKYALADGLHFAVLTENFVASALRAAVPNTGYGLFGESPALAAQLQRLFEWDWAMAGGAPPDPGAGGAEAPTPAPEPAPAAGGNGSGSVPLGRLVVSPGGAEALGAWVELAESARATVQVESLTADAGTLGPDGPLGAALLRAAARGVRVTVLLAPPAPAAPAPEPGAALATAARALGVPLEVRTDSRPLTNASKMHAKVVVADAAAFILGSHNLVASAFYSNREVSLRVDDATAASWLAARLAADFERASPVAPPAFALGPGSTLGRAEPDGAGGAPVAPTPAALLVGAAGALALSVVPRRHRRVRPQARLWPRGGRASRRRAVAPAAQPGALPPPAAATPGPRLAFDLRVAGLEPPAPPLPPPHVGLPPSALDRLRKGDR
ncbi:MAG TPA: phospholipase D-like domain-containing protein [Candidatus Thermoplasmatota archaeon]